MTEGELLALIGQQEKAALGSSVSTGPTVGGQLLPTGQAMNTLEVDRYNALNTYFGRPMGNEVEDRSQVVLPELRDTIEWIKPQLMRMFVGTTKVCEFEPETPEDEEQAQVETDVVNHVFMKQNNGFFVLHDFFTDALLLRNGYAKVYFEEKDKTSVERYTGLSETEVSQLIQSDDSIQIVEQNEYSQLVQMPGMAPQAAQCFDIKIRRTRKVKAIKIECLPPEEVLVSSKARRNLHDCPFVEHKTKTTKSSLKEQGFDESKIDKIGKGSPNWMNLIALARDTVTDQLSESESNDQASAEVDLREVYVRVDFDEDGVTELRRVMIGGDQILENEECEEIPIVYCSPIRMPHRHVGISYYDLLVDLQAIKTTLFRQALDNLYISNNQRTAINYNNVNISDLITTRPGGVVRVNGAPGENILPMTSDGLMMQQVIPALEYVDNVREMRTGIGKDTMGVDADALQNLTKGGQIAAMGAAAMKVELVARMLAEGVKDLFMLIHSTLIRHQDEPMAIQLSDKWLNVNPAEWRERSRISVNVGLGSGTKEESRANLAMLIQMQGQLMPFGLVGPEQAYETFKKGAQLLGYEQPERFAMDPSSQEYQQKMAQQQQTPPDPRVVAAQINQQATREKIQGDERIEAIRSQGKAQEQVLNLKKELIQKDAELSHAAAQGEADRNNQLAQFDSDMAQTLVKVIGQIVAAQLKQAPQVDAGETLSHDFNEAYARI